MCGIAGFTHSNARSQREILDLALDAIRHRGPDQSGSFHSTAISMGAVRLKVIDLTGGDQPIVSEDGQHVIVFNGEIYNHPQLRPELERRGHRYATNSDTETILHLYEEYGEESVNHLRGMFSFAIWDSRCSTGLMTGYSVRKYGPTPSATR